ncbi:alpha/beta hydrolase [Acidiferrimicrobium sp. IK]|uniref:alpha/beta fold hydrolase n=1 Tax=Acidiferrimicrobium sp. IK TaxID=2871700 RepID=UPI0021CAE800|nr:alpha/beta hydrolase [Acidiferrimicrobium sp. IK]MCU4186847.1 alpha/beta hydrolase [Acidiferrimicrobium sp. IK]
MTGRPGSIERLELAGGPVEVQRIPGVGPPLVLLHEGLGSLGLWRGFPAALAERTGREVVVWSRHGYGRSAVVRGPRRVGYMHDEALSVLPEFLDALGVERPVLVGHSDGASIALIYAGGSAVGGLGVGGSGVGGSGPIAAVVAIAPHVVVEERTLAAIREARDAYRDTDLRERLARHHNDPDATFRGWNDIWLDPAFAAWNIEGYLPGIVCPVLVVQCEDDPYGTLDQVERIADEVSGPVSRCVLPAGGHAPHLSHPDEVLDAIAGLVVSLPGG